MFRQIFCYYAIPVQYNLLTSSEKCISVFHSNSKCSDKTLEPGKSTLTNISDTSYALTYTTLHAYAAIKAFTSKLLNSKLD